MNIENKELIEKTTSVLDKIMNFFKKVINKQTVTDKGTLHHAGEMEEGTEVYQDEDMTTPAPEDTYTTSTGKKIGIKGGQIEKIIPATDDDDVEVDDELPINKFKGAKATDVQNKVLEIKAKLHAQNQLLNEAKAALDAANESLKKTREEVKNEIKSDFIPEGSKRSNKAKSETSPFFSPQTTLAQNAVKKAIAK